MVCVAQLVRVAGCDSVGRGFESHLVPQYSRLRGGMVDTIDSKSIAGDCVRVQVSSPVLRKTIRKDSFLYFKLNESDVLQQDSTPQDMMQNSRGWLASP